MNDLDFPDMVDFETVSTCNRVCPTCLRNSYPDREKVAPWFTPNFLPVEIIKEALDQCVEMGFHGGICLNHYNEPLTDPRIIDIVDMVWKYHEHFFPIYFHTNGDLMTEEIASKLDGKLDKIVITLYMDEPVKSKRKAWMESLFKVTVPVIITMSEHIITHYSPKGDVVALVEKHKNNPCSEAERRIVINHRRQYLLCCDDMLGHFNLGTFPEISLKDYWWGEPHYSIAMDLRKPGGRLKHPHCATCPRT